MQRNVELFKATIRKRQDLIQLKYLKKTWRIFEKVQISLKVENSLDFFFPEISSLGMFLCNKPDNFSSMGDAQRLFK